MCVCVYAVYVCREIMVTDSNMKLKVRRENKEKVRKERKLNKRNVDLAYVQCSRRNANLRLPS